MLDYAVRIGLVPERRYLPGPKRTGIFNPDYAVENKNRAVKYIKEHFSDENTVFFDLDFLNDEGLLYHVDQCEAVRDYFLKHKVDAIFILNCNFGNEEAAGEIAKMMRLPTLLWGPIDTVFDADGTRYTDAQCGLFAISKQLKRANLPFSYIENCDVADPVFADGLRQFLSVTCMLKNFKKLKIAQVGVRLQPFKSVASNEVELMEQFGIDITPVNMAVASEKLERIFKEEQTALKRLLQETRQKFDLGSTDEETLLKMMTFVKFYQELFLETGADVISTECWTSMQLAFGAMPCLAMSLLADMGYPVICESDIHGAISSALLSCAARGKVPPLFGEFTTRNPQNKNAELLWHCGPFAFSSKRPGAKASLYNLRPSFPTADGEYTICRFQGERGKYYLLGGGFHTTEGPYTFGTYMWAEFPDLSKVERKLIEGPYIHHMSEILGNFTGVLKEFAKFVPNLVFEDINE